MSREEILAELLQQWKKAVEFETSITPEELCRDYPELLEDFRRLLEGPPTIDRTAMCDFVPVAKEDIPTSNDDRKPIVALSPIDGTAVCDFVPVAPEEIEPTDDAGRFRPVSFHAKGGLGVVWVAEDRELGRRVALKSMQRPDGPNSNSRMRFLAEARITGNLEHPGIVPVYGLGQDAGGKPFYAMRFIRGQTLGDAIKSYHESKSHDSAERHVELHRLLRHFIAVCETMAYAHDRGVVHRDIKPANIMIGPYGETLVVDWGLAKFVAETPWEVPETDSLIEAMKQWNLAINATVHGSAKGSPAYMSPEQARGESDRIGPASDVYSLGSTFFELLTGHRAYDAPSVAQLLENVRAGKALTPRAVHPDVAPALDAVCRKAMAFEPARRYASARELAKDVERWLADEPVLAWKEPFSIRARRWLRRNRTLVTSSVAALIIALCAAIALAMQQREAGKVLKDKNDLLVQAKGELEGANQGLTQLNIELAASNHREKDARIEAFKERDRAEDNRRLARKTLYPAVMNIVAASVAEHRYEHANALLREVMPLPGDPIDHRRFEWFHTWNSLHKVELRSLQIDKEPERLILSDDGALLAARCGGNAIVYRVADGERLLTLPITKWNPDFDLARRGRFLVARDRKNIEIWTIPDKGQPKARLTIKAFDKWVSALALSYDERRLVATGDNGKIRVWNVQDGKLLHDIPHSVWTVKAPTTELYWVAISRDGERIAFTYFGVPVLINLATESAVKIVSPPGDRQSIEFTDAGSVCVRTSKGIWSWTPSPFRQDYSLATARYFPATNDVHDISEVLKAGEAPTLYLRSAERIMGFRTPLGRYEFAMPDSPPARPLNAVPFDIRSVQDIKAFAMRSDGKMLACADRSGLVTLLDAEKSAEPTLLLRHPDENAVNGLAFMPDGRLFSLSAYGGLLRSLPHKATDLRVQAKDLRNVGGVRFAKASMTLSPDGRWYAMRNGSQISIHRANDGLSWCRFGINQITPDAITIPMAIPRNQNILIFANDRTRDFRLPGKPPSSMLAVIDFEQLGSYERLSTCASIVGGAMVQSHFEQFAVAKCSKSINLPSHVDDLDVSGDGRLLAVVSQDNMARIFRLDKFGSKPVRQMPVPTRTRCVRFSPNGAWVAAGDNEGSVWIWSLNTESEPMRIVAHRGEVNSLLFDADSQTLITGGIDGKVRFLIRELPQERFTLETGAPVHSLALSPDGRSLAVGDNAGVVRLYEAGQSSAVLEAARKSWKEAARNDLEKTRHYLLALWSGYLDRKKAGDPNAKELLQEAIEVGAKVREDQRKALADWLEAFANEKKKTSGEM